MNKIFAVILLLTTLAFRSADKEFSGRIVYRNTFTTLQGADLSDKLAPYLGAEQWYYISGGNYKAYNEKKQLTQLYVRDVNQYQYFLGGQLQQTYDAASTLSKQVQITPLTETLTVAGYPCKAVKIVADDISTVYYYAPGLRVKTDDYSKHMFGEWYPYLKATEGGLTLKYISTNAKVGYIMTGEAISVDKMALKAADFTATAPAQ